MTWMPQVGLSSMASIFDWRPIPIPSQQELEELALEHVTAPILALPDKLLS